MTQEHPFAPFIRILGKGPSLSRPLEAAEMRAAARMILADEVEQLQLGAFFCLLRVNGETAAELAGFAQAARETMQQARIRPIDSPTVSIDWPCYAGKKRRLPWFLLSALLLAQTGRTVLLHGLDQHTEGRIWASDALASIGIVASADPAAAADNLHKHGIAYLPLDVIAPRLATLMRLKPLLGLRSPLHSVVRHLNPFSAECQLIGVAHPAYRPLHRAAAAMLGDGRVAVLKGDGGEAERVPEKACDVALLRNHVAEDMVWPALLPSPRRETTSLDLTSLAALWRGQQDDAAGEASVIGTTAIALYTLGDAATPAAAEQLARELWQARERDTVRAN